MKEYDVFIAGGGIAGSVAAKFAAKGGLKTLFVEKRKTPRNKPCSGIQFGYLEKIIDERFPPEKLCSNTLKKIEMTFPNGKTIKAPFKMFNFMRDTFDDWLNKVGIRYGAEFRDECNCTDFEILEKNIIISLTNNAGKVEKIKSKYVIDATGLRPFFRRKLRPSDFQRGSSGSAINYYFKNGGSLDSNMLYMFWNLDYNNMMFAWIYKKSDLWCIGTGYDKDARKHLNMFLDYAKEKYSLKIKEIVKTEGYSSSIDFNNETRVWLGEKRILMVGDAAGLIDLSRGVGMDSAALSGRIAAKAIIEAKRKEKDALEVYTRLMKRLVDQTRKNQDKGINIFKSNEELQNYLDKNMTRMGIAMVVQSFLNKFRSAEKMILLPP
ncbi:MAG: NAD(P)/FAD-dependent oxidoreductase [Candidatus Hodarchaeales archaeon]